MADADAPGGGGKDEPLPSVVALSSSTTSNAYNATPESAQIPREATRSRAGTSTSQPRHTAAAMAVDVDDFGLPMRKYAAPAAGRRRQSSSAASAASVERSVTSRKSSTSQPYKPHAPRNRDSRASSTTKTSDANHDEVNSDAEDDFKDAVSRPASGTISAHDTEADEEDEPKTPMPPQPAQRNSAVGSEHEDHDRPSEMPEDQAISEAKKDSQKIDHSRDTSVASGATGLGIGLSEFSHQQLTAQKVEEENDNDVGWQVMPAYAPYDIYNDDDQLVAKEHVEDEDEKYTYAGIGGAGKGYTRVDLDEDAQSATSMDENTQYLFNEVAKGTSITQDDEAQRDAVSQLQATKDLLTEGQRIAYVGLTRLELSSMLKEFEEIKHTRSTKKQVQTSLESMRMWSQKMMVRLYTHMDISPAEQIMIEQLSSHGVLPNDLVPVLMANARVKNPMAEDEKSPTKSALASGANSPSKQSLSASNSPRPSSARSEQRVTEEKEDADDTEEPAAPPPAYNPTANEDELSVPVRTPSQLPTTEKIDIDLRWTVLCDLFLVLIADSIYDSRSRVLLERVGQDLEITGLDICRFEKKVTDALEMQQNAEKENWNEEQHMETRRKLALRRRYVMMGLATVGGGLVIGLSAGLLAPMIGAGLAAGFTTIGVTGTSGFLAGAGGATIITSGAAASGSIIGAKAANRRTGAVKTFEYRPLHNNKRVNLIVTVSGWMTGKVDDVRLPYSTVDSVMGDIYSVLWEPEMLTSMGDTINILATEALTQGLQQILGSTILVSLMAALQLPVVLTKLAYLIDNPWAVSLDRATAAGLILADSLIDRNLGTRPVTLVGYSLGSRVIFSCLQELARKGAVGLVQNAYLFGSPVVVKHDEYLRARTVVSGRFVNGYNRNDWILGYLFRLTNGGIRRVAGLAVIDGIPGIENMDLTDNVKGHMEYRTAMPRLLRECGWLVGSDEFSEIEDPDPENHQQRQRELINEIEEARKELEKDPKAAKGGFGAFFTRRKRARERQEWEVYEDRGKKSPGKGPEDKTGGVGQGGVLFDVDAIRAELAKERQEQLEREPNGADAAAVAAAKEDEELMLQVREIKSTLPPMRLDLSPTPSSSPAPANGALHRLSTEHRRSYDSRVSSEPRVSSVATRPDESDGIQMTFDTSFDDTRPPPPPKDRPATARPGVHGASSVPNIKVSNSSHYDVDDEEFGKEKEIEMTFA